MSDSLYASNTLFRVAEIWGDYRRYLQEKYPPKDGERWEFSCDHHRRINKLLEPFEKERLYLKSLQLMEALNEKEREHAHILNYLIDMVAQTCSDMDGNLNSDGISTQADALYKLHELGIVEIIEAHGRVVKARWKKKGEGDDTDV